MNHIIERVLDFLFIEKCDICNNMGKCNICDNCLFHFKMLQENKINHYHNKAYDKHFWMYKYSDEIRELIIQYKFGDKSYLCRMFARMVLEDEKALEYIKSFDIIIPVPIHKKRMNQRGYNQSYLIAKEICYSIDNIALINNLIKKTKNNCPQSTLDRLSRINNVKGSYEIDMNTARRYDLENKKILIIDDVYTTGSTVNECANEIKKITNCEICVLTIAKD